MFLTPLPRTFFGKVQFFLSFGLVLLLGILVWPVVALYDLLAPRKPEEDFLDWKENDSFDDEDDEDPEDDEKE